MILVTFSLGLAFLAVIRSVYLTWQRDTLQQRNDELIGNNLRLVCQKEELLGDNISLRIHLSDALSDHQSPVRG